MKKTSIGGTAFIRLDTKEKVELTNLLIKETGIFTSTGAFIKAGEGYLQYKKMYRSQQEMIEKLSEELRQAQTILQSLYHANENLQAYGKKKFVPGKFPQGKLF